MIRGQLKAPAQCPDWNQQPTAFIRPLCCILSDPFVRKVALNTPLRWAASSTVACTFCACARCSKQVALHENRKWRNGVHRKTKRTVFHPSHTPRWFASTLPITMVTQPLRESNGWDGRQPTSSDFACWIGADNVHGAQKASNAAEHTKRICSQPHPSLPKRFRCPTVGPVCSCLNIC